VCARPSGAGVARCGWTHGRVIRDNTPAVRRWRRTGVRLRFGLAEEFFNESRAVHYVQHSPAALFRVRLPPESKLAVARMAADKVTDLQKTLRSALQRMGFDTGADLAIGGDPGFETRCPYFCVGLQGSGYGVRESARRTVPRGTSRLRLSLTGTYFGGCARDLSRAGGNPRRNVISNARFQLSMKGFFVPARHGNRQTNTVLSACWLPHGWSLLGNRCHRASKATDREPFACG